MNNNLKELIEDIKYGIENGTDRENIKIDGYCLSWKNCKLILNEIERLNNIIEKAVEYIKENIVDIDFVKEHYDINFYDLEISIENVIDLLNILNGRSDE